jgi:hypothetical protein
LEKRRETERRRYYKNLGRPYPYENSNDKESAEPEEISLADSAPSPEKVPGFNSPSKGKSNLFASIRPHLGSLLALIAGIGAGVGVEIATRNVQVKAGEEIKKLMATEREDRPLTATERANQSMAGLLDYAEKVMENAASPGNP